MSVLEIDGRRVEVSRPDKVLSPQDGITKQQLADYYAKVSGVMVPHVAGRAVTMQRFPDGLDGQGFFEKKAPSHFPAWVSRVELKTGEGRQQQVVINDAATLVYLADQACITPHVWLARDDDLDHPDQMIFDLDPPHQDVARVRHATRAVGDLLGELGLVAFVKTTGSKGFHVQVPLDGTADFDTVRGFTRRAAEIVAVRDPDRFTTEQRKDKRGGRVYIDFMRNAYGQTAVAPYSVRARDNAPVATPIEWSELRRTTPDGYTMKSVGRRLAQRDDPWQHMHREAASLDQPAKALEELENA